MLEAPAEPTTRRVLWITCGVFKGLCVVTEMCSGSKAGFYSRRIDLCITQTPNPYTECGGRDAREPWRPPNRQPGSPLHPRKVDIRLPGKHFTPCTLHPTPYTLHPTPYNLNPTHYTLHPAPCTLHPTPHTPHPETRNSKPQTPNPQSGIRSRAGKAADRAGQRADCLTCAIF